MTRTLLIILAFPLTFYAGGLYKELAIVEKVNAKIIMTHEDMVKLRVLEKMYLNDIYKEKAEGLEYQLRQSCPAEARPEILRRNTIYTGNTD